MQRLSFVISAHHELILSFHQDHLTFIVACLADFSKSLFYVYDSRNRTEMANRFGYVFLI